MNTQELTLIQDKIARNRARRENVLFRLRHKNSNPTQAPAQFRGQASGNVASARVVVTKVKANCRIESYEQVLARVFTEGGWQVRRHVNDHEFIPAKLHNRQVAFSVRNEQNEVREYSGELEAFSVAGSALFRLAETKQIFNANMVGFMAVMPA